MKNQKETKKRVEKPRYVQYQVGMYIDDLRLTPEINRQCEVYARYEEEDEDLVVHAIWYTISIPQELENKLVYIFDNDDNVFDYVLVDEN